MKKYGLIEKIYDPSYPIALLAEDVFGLMQELETYKKALELACQSLEIEVCGERPHLLEYPANSQYWLDMAEKEKIQSGKVC